MIERIVLWTIIVILAASHVSAQIYPCDKSGGFMLPPSSIGRHQLVPGDGKTDPDQTCVTIGETI